MKRYVGGAVGAVALIVTSVAGATAVSTGVGPARDRSAQAQAPARPQAPPSSQAERGRYLVHDVAMCVQCHSPRDGAGNLVPSKLLHGAPMPASAPSLPIAWAFQTPRLAGLPAGFTEETFIEFLQTGARTNRHVPKAPMPPFRMTEADASAVAAYLKTLR
jgi:mono/diheme cytochrome c family protein